MKEPVALKLIKCIFPIVGGGFLIGCGYTALRLFRYRAELEEGYFIFPMVFGLLGTIFLVIGVVMNLVGRGADKKQRMLLETGQRVTAYITDIEPDYSLAVNGRHPYRLYCEYEEGGVIYRCRSHHLWSRPVVDQETVSVYRDPDDYGTYYVDVEAILRPVVEL